MDFELNEEQRMLQETVRKFAILRYVCLFNVVPKSLGTLYPSLDDTIIWTINLFNDWLLSRNIRRSALIL